MEQTPVYHDDVFFEEAGHGDNVPGGIAQRRGWLNTCTLFLLILIATQQVQVIWLVFIHSNNICCVHCMFDHPVDADQVFRRVRITFFLYSLIQ